MKSNGWPADLVQSENYLKLDILCQKQGGGGGGGLDGEMAQSLKGSHNQKESEST